MTRLVASRTCACVDRRGHLAEAIRDGLRLDAIAADIAVLGRDIPGPSGDEIAERIVASGSGMPILMLTAADRLDDKVSGFELGADAVVLDCAGLDHYDRACAETVGAWVNRQQSDGRAITLIPPPATANAFDGRGSNDRDGQETMNAA